MLCVKLPTDHFMKRFAFCYEEIKFVWWYGHLFIQNVLVNIQSCTLLCSKQSCGTRRTEVMSFCLTGISVTSA